MYLENCLELSDLLVCNEVGVAHIEMRIVVRMHCSAGVVGGHVIDLLHGITDTFEGQPIVMALV